MNVLIPPSALGLEKTPYFTFSGRCTNIPEMGIEKYRQVLPKAHVIGNTAKGESIKKLEGKYMSNDLSIVNGEPDHPIPGMDYIPCESPSGNAFCSDNDCPCNEVTIKRGKGYIFMSKKVTIFRQNARTIEDVKAKLYRQMLHLMGPNTIHINTPDPSTYSPILVCKQGAESRNIDLEIAAKDARYWWTTDTVPLRATPRVWL